MKKKMKNENMKIRMKIENMKNMKMKNGKI